MLVSASLLKHQSVSVTTTFSDSVATISRAAMDRAGTGQRFAVAIIEAGEVLMSQNDSVTTRWTPAHLGWVGGSKVADEWAKVAAEAQRTQCKGRTCRKRASDT